MVSFYVYDIAFMILFMLGIAFLLVKNKKRVTREGVMFMFRTKWGEKSMKRFDDKHHKLLGNLRYVIIAVGFVLMILMMMMLIQSAWVYVSQPEISEIIKAPPIAPLIPYFPELFGMESLFPPFYFAYFLIAITIVGLVHEFSHGIFMRYSKTKIKSTGIVFLGPIPGAFVEQDDDSFQKKSRVNQMSVLGAGVFANLLTAILFYLLYMGFFAMSFSASGYVFSSYSGNLINVSNYEINQIGNNLVLSNGELEYFLDVNILAQLGNSEIVYAYDNTPAFQNRLTGVINGIDDVKISDQSDLAEALSRYKPNDKVVVSTQTDSFNIVLGEHPENESRAYLGVVNFGNSQTGMKKFLATLMGFRDSSTYYETRWNSDFVEFIYHLLWWIMIINILVALFNMLPWGILDGGRFLTLGIGKFTSEKVAKGISKFVGRFILMLFALMMAFWVIRLF